MPTSFAPSPIANVTLPVPVFTSLVTCITNKSGNLFRTEILFTQKEREKKLRCSWAYKCFLLGWRAAANDRSTTNCKIKERALCVVLQCICKRLPVNNQGKGFTSRCICKFLSLIYLLHHTILWCLQYSRRLTELFFFFYNRLTKLLFSNILYSKNENAPIHSLICVLRKTLLIITGSSSGTFVMAALSLPFSNAIISAVSRVMIICFIPCLNKLQAYLRNRSIVF